MADEQKVEGANQDSALDNFILMAGVLGPLGWVGWLGYMGYLFLRYGQVGADPGLTALNDLGMRIDWLAAPETWIGLSGLIATVLNLFGPVGVVGMPFFLVIMIRK